MKLVLLLPWLLSCAIMSFAGDAKPVSAAVGKQFKITLPSNPTTGYSWRLARPLDEAKVKLVTNTYRRAETKLIGAAGQEIWTFKAVGTGNTTIVLQYVRPWEKGARPAQTTNVPVTVPVSQTAQ